MQVYYMRALAHGMLVEARKALVGGEDAPLEAWRAYQELSHHKDAKPLESGKRRLEVLEEGGGGGCPVLDPPSLDALITALRGELCGGAASGAEGRPSVELGLLVEACGAQEGKEALFRLSRAELDDALRGVTPATVERVCSRWEAEEEATPTPTAM